LGGTAKRMRFHWLNLQGVRSDEGFEVQCIHRFAFEYREGGRIATVESEDGMLGGVEPVIIIDPTAFDRWDDGAIIPEEEKGRLLENFRLALEFQGLGLKVEKAL